MDELKQSIREQAITCILVERIKQEERKWNDRFNNEGLWTSYIANYASRWSMPESFDLKKYSFRECMVKVAALALAAIEWDDVELDS